MKSYIIDDENKNNLIQKINTNNKFSVKLKRKQIIKNEQ